jgi:hypothetical protein
MHALLVNGSGIDLRTVLKIIKGVNKSDAIIIDRVLPIAV